MNPIQKIKIYYFSGTGNAKNISNWIQRDALKSKITTEVVDISTLAKRKKIRVDKDDTIGFCCPTHGFNFPPIMFHFILRFPRSKGNKVFIINTRAGMKLGKIFLPGISGLAQFFSALVLLIKRYKIVGMYPIDLPSNWISFHPGIKAKVVESIYKRRKLDTQRFTNKLLNNKRSYKGLRAIIVDIAITPIAFLYYIIGRFLLAKSFYASHKCTHCNLCIKKCPIQAIKEVDKRPFWTYKCESCMQCMNICPERAIETAHGFFIGIYYLITSILIIQIYKLLNLVELINNYIPESFNKLIHFVIDTALLFLMFFGFYWVFHYLLRFKIFERIVLYTSLTNWKFWRRYKPPKNV